MIFEYISNKTYNKLNEVKFRRMYSSICKNKSK